MIRGVSLLRVCVCVCVCDRLKEVLQEKEVTQPSDS